MILPLMLCLMARYQYLQYFMLPKHLRFDQEVSVFFFHHQLLRLTFLVD